MSPFDLTTKEVIKKYNLQAQKSFGQNFIINQSLTDKIVGHFEGIEDQTIIEVGPGPGGLTRAIIAKDLKKLYLIELDNKFESLFADLQVAYGERLGVKFADILKVKFSEFGNDIGIISNLPYNISTPFLIKCCFEAENINQMLLMFQREVAERIIASPGSKVFGRLSVMAQSFFEIKKVVNVGPSAFHPPPKVNSAVLHFKRKITLPDNIRVKQLEKIAAELFCKRRKKISTILKHYDCSGVSVDLNKRPEQLQLKDFHELAKLVKL